MSIRILIVLVFTFLYISSNAQEADLKTKLAGKKNFFEIQKEIDSYYEGKEDNWKGINGEDPKIKHIKRWEWYMSGRLGPNGELVDIPGKLMAAKKQMQKQYKDANLPTRDINPFWFSVGPSSTDGSGIGRADRIAFHPSNENIFYVGTSGGGLWRTTNGGTSWQALTDHIPSLGISGVVVSWADPNDLYILTGDGDSDYQGGFVDQFNYFRRSVGVLKSTDGGLTWTQTGVLDTLPYLPYELMQDPTDANTLLAATSNGLYRTTNRGNSWTRTLNDDIYDIKFKPGTTRAYAASNTNVYYSINGGFTWQTATLDVPLAGAARIEIEVTPSNSSRVYILVGDVDGASQFDGVYRSTNNGVNYTQRATSPNILGGASNGTSSTHQARYDLSLAVASDNSNIVISGAVRIWKSTDGAATFPSVKPGTHADIHDLAYNPLNHNLYACTDGGVYVSDDDAESWTPLLDGFRVSQLYHMDGTLLDNNFLLGGFQDNGLKLKHGVGSFWDHVQSADGFDCSFYPDDETKFYGTLNKQVYRYSSSGTSSTGITPPGGDSGANYDWFGTVAAHVSDQDYVFVGYDDVFVSDDEGSSWTNTGVSGSWSLATCETNGDRLYAAGSSDYKDGIGGMWRNDDITNGGGWTTLHTKPGFPANTTISKITDIAVSPTSHSNIMVTIGGFTEGSKVYRSFTSGDSWLPFSGTLPNIPINCGAIAPGGQDFYIGTDLGVFYRNINMSDWMPFHNGMPNVPVTELFINSNNGFLYAATFGRGVWRSELATNCPENLILIGIMKGDYLYQANNQVVSTTNVAGGVGTEVFFKGGNRVILGPGFVAERHTKFQAYIGGCGEGGIPE